MDKLKIRLENCYGIRKLEHEFDFREKNAHVVYAPNGSMKTSLAKVFRDLSQGKRPVDRIFTSRESYSKVVDDADGNLDPEAIFVVDSCDEAFRSEKTSTLLANAELKQAFEETHASVETALSRLYTPMSRSAGIRKGLWETLCSDFGHEEKGVYEAIKEACDAVEHSGIPPLEDLRYSEVVNEKVVAFLESPDFKRQLAEYISKYDELLEKSRFFRKGSFNHYGAKSVAKSLNDAKFFEAEHTVKLADREGASTEITTAQALEESIEQEKNTILSDPDLLSRFEKIDSELNNKKELRVLRDKIAARPDLLRELEDFGLFKRRLWIAYVAAMDELARTYLRTYEEARERIEQLTAAAVSESTEWDRVVRQFNERFDVPFRLDMTNQEDVILRDIAPSVLFSYTDGTEKVQIGDKGLFEVLSMGELRALYMLNILFEVRARANAEASSLLIFDDIADSFDYKNKYAIVEYLRSISQNSKFRMIILTHNYDFFRTVGSRLDIEKTSYMCRRSENGLYLEQLKMRDPLEYWMKRMDSERRCFLGAIPMVRNIVKYTKGSKSKEYTLLTSVLHIKHDSDAITLSQLASVYTDTLHIEVSGDDVPAIPTILEEAEACVESDDSISLENKVILSAAIRLTAERYMVDSLEGRMEIGEIKGNQTPALVNHYKEAFPERDKELAVLDRVVLMTPESIHLNSFVYEPLIDMSDTNLRSLYRDVRGLREASA